MDDGKIPFRRKWIKCHQKISNIIKIPKKISKSLGRSYLETVMSWWVGKTC